MLFRESLCDENSTKIEIVLCYLTDEKNILGDCKHDRNRGKPEKRMGAGGAFLFVATCTVCGLHRALCLLPFNAAPVAI